MITIHKSNPLLNKFPNLEANCSKIELLKDYHKIVNKKSLLSNLLNYLNYLIIYLVIKSNSLISKINMFNILHHKMESY